MSDQKSCIARSASHGTFILPVRVYYEDTDAGGVVYHSTYLNFFERSRTEWLRQLGYELDELTYEDHVLFVVRSVSCHYLMPAIFNDELFVSAEIIELGRAHIIFEQKVMRANHQDEDVHCDVLATGVVTVVCVDSNKMRPKRIPEKLTETLKSVI